MGTIDLILNLAGVMLLLSWRSQRLDPVWRRTPATLVGTLRPAHERRFRGWHFLAALVVLVFVRGWLYWQIGSPADWTPKLDLGLILLPLRVDHLGLALLYSALSLVRVLFLFFCWMMLLLVINRRLGETDPIHKVLQAQAGPLGRWPGYVQGLLPPLLVVLSWAALQPVLTRLGLVIPAKSFGQICEQGLLIAAAMLLSVKYLIGAVLLLYLLCSYVYLGHSPFWDFISATAGNLLGPLRWLPLRTGKLDLAPLAAIVLVFVLLHTVPNLITAKAAERQVTLWPQ